MTEAIELQAADPAWPAAFEAERALILQCLATPPRRLEHMGSTRRVAWDP